ncbi:MAG: c-type cytochrome [Deltaproteobacteria bacterium]|nr:c-type cytochrome [Deltaproteobacteria bacterium]
MPAGSAADPTGATCTGLEPVGGDPVPASVAQLVVGATQVQKVASPGVSGGTLLVLPDGRTAVAADPDRDQVYVVDLSSHRLSATLVLNRNDQPGRVVSDPSGRVHVVLRGGGALVTIDPTAGVISQRRQICAAPRGLAHDAAMDLIHVVCAGGELISLSAGGGPAVRTLKLDRDLRDVVIDRDHLRVSRFRSAEIIAVAANGTVSSRSHLGDFRSPTTRGGQLFTPSVAWRMVGMPGGGMAVVHQRGVDDEVQQSGVGSYGGGNPCHSIVHSAVTRIAADGSILNGPALADFPLAVDIAVSPDGKNVAVVSAGNGHSKSLPAGGFMSSVHVGGMDAFSDGKRGCLRGAGRSPCAPHEISSASQADCSQIVPGVVGEAIAVAFTASGAVIVQSREPAVLNLPGGGTIQLSAEIRNDTGHMLFHANAGAGLACASCHVEGADDGRVWNFACAGGRRTQSLQTGIRGTEPFHWEGDQKDFPKLVGEVFTTRMSGPRLQADQADAMLSWLDNQPRPATTSAADTVAVQRGRALYHDPVGANCGSCHSGARLTNNATVDVGTGGAFQVPSLVGIASRAPYMHDGCAKSLSDRFAPACGGGDKHGRTSNLSPAELADLLSYLETL